MAFHPGPPLPELGFTWDPWATSGIALLVAGYGIGLVRLWSRAGVGKGVSIGQALAFAGAAVTLLLALVSPLDAWSDWLFSAHMGQHELLMIVAAPLVVLGRAGYVLLWCLPDRSRLALAAALRAPAVETVWVFCTTPLFILALHTVTRWAWHAPVLFEAALRSELVHAVQHLTFFVTAALFWWTVLQGRYGRVGYGVAFLFVFATATHTATLGALLSTAPRVLYGTYAGRAPARGFDALEDQQLAGLLMWVPAGLLLFLIALGMFAAWLEGAERARQRAARSERNTG